MYDLINVLEKYSPEILKKISGEELERFLYNIQAGGNCCPATVITKLTGAELALLHTAACYPQFNNGEYITVAQTAAQLGISAPAVSRTLKNLESKGYVSRQTNPDDRRSVYICVTENGLSAMTECIIESVKIVNEALSDFTDEELRTMIHLHNKLTNNMTKVITAKKREIAKGATTNA